MKCNDETCSMCGGAQGFSAGFTRRSTTPGSAIAYEMEIGDQHPMQNARKEEADLRTHTHVVLLIDTRADRSPCKTSIQEDSKAEMHR